MRSRLRLRSGEDAFRLHYRLRSSERRSGLPRRCHGPLYASDKNAKHWAARVIFVSDSHIAVVSCGEALASRDACDGAGESPHHVTVINLGASLVMVPSNPPARAYLQRGPTSRHCPPIFAPCGRAFLAQSQIPDSAFSNASRLPGNVSAALSLNASA